MKEAEKSSQFGIYDNLDYASSSPNIIIRESFIIMNSPRTPGDTDQKHLATSFLLDETLDLIKHMEQGLFIEAIETDKFTTNEKKQAEKLLAPTVHFQRASEAFGIAKTTLGIMPRKLKFNFGQYRVPYSLRGRLKPPETLEEHKDKLSALRKGVVNFAVDTEDKSFINYATDFMMISSQTELKAPATEHELKQVTDYKIRRMFQVSADESITIFEQ